MNEQAAASSSDLPIDRLRGGRMTDAEIVSLAADTIRANAAPTDKTRALWDALAQRLELVRLIDPRQTRAATTYGGQHV